MSAGIVVELESAGTRTPRRTRADRSFTDLVRRSPVVRIGGQVVVVAVLLGIYSLVRLASPSLERQLPAVSDILVAVGAQLVSPEFWGAAGYTIGVVATSLLLSVLAGAVIGGLLSLHRNAFRSAQFIIDFMRAIPPLALIPVGLLILGPNARMEIVLSVVSVVWIVLLQVYFAVQDLDPKLIETARAYRVTPGRRIFNVFVPAVSPPVATAIRLSASVCLLIAVGIELLATGKGLGFLVLSGQITGQFAESYAVVLIIGTIGVVMNLGLESAERRLLAWHRRESKGT